MNDVEYYQFNKESDDYKVWPFKERFHLLLNLAVGGSWGGVKGIDNSIFPQKMEVDYVRVYQLQQATYPCEVVNLSHGIAIKSPDSISYTAGTSIQVNAQPNSGFIFHKWYGTVQNTVANLSLTMNKSYTQIPEFIRSGEMISNKF